MEPFISLASDNAGLDSQSPRPLALKPTAHGFETAPVHSDGRPPQMNKRKFKSRMKELENIRCPDSPSDASDSGTYPQNTQPEFKGFPPVSLDSNCCKRRRITEDSEDCSKSDHSNANFSTISHSDLGRKAQSTNNEPLDFHSDMSNAPSPKKSEEKDSCPGWSTMKEKSWKKNKSSSSFSSSESTSQDADFHGDYASIARSLCCALKGKLLSTEVVSGRGGNKGLSFQCSNHHQFIISLSTLNKLSMSKGAKSYQDVWCLKCRNFLSKTKERAKELNSTVLNSCLSKGSVEVKCREDHTFVINYTKNHSKAWCDQCKDAQAKKKQEEYAHSKQKEEERKLKEQQRLFEESQRQVEEEQQKKSMAFSTPHEAYYYEETMKQICAYCKKKTEREMSSSAYKGEANATEIYNVYKVMYLPFPVLVKSLLLNDSSQLNLNYRQGWLKLALLLHPDKNKHKYAKDAFTKITSAYEVCKQVI